MFLFDLDGTLIDSNGVWKDVDREFLARRGIPYSHAYYAGVAHSTLSQAAIFTKQFCHLSESCEDIIAEWKSMTKDLYANVTIKPGVRAYLKQCKQEGIPMAMVTSSIPEHCHAALKHLNLESYFNNITFAQDLELEKHNPEIWLEAARRNGVRPQECMVFDDSLSACLGARAANMRVIGVYDSHFSKDETEMRAFCDEYIMSFEELLHPPKESNENK